MLLQRCILTFILFASIVATKCELVAWWSFDDPITTNIVDVRNQNPGLPINVTQIDGRVGSGALRFNGTNSALRLNETTPGITLAGTPYTIAWWQRWRGWNPLTGQTYQNVLGYDDGLDASGGYALIIAKNSDSLLIAQNAGPGPSQHWFSGVSPTLNEWQHFAVVFNGLTRTLYVNGAQVGSIPTTGLILDDGDDQFVMGALWSQGSLVNFFNGDLDEVQIYSRALTSDEISGIAEGNQLVIMLQPRDTSAATGGSATFTVSAISSRGDPVAYQWFQSSQPLQGETNPSLTVTAGSLAGTTPFQVVVTNATGSLTSHVAILQTYATNNTDLIAHWTFNDPTGVVRDIVSGYEGTAIGTVKIPGRIGPGAARFNGNGYIRVLEKDTRLRLTNGPYSISWWQAWSGGARPQCIIGSDDGKDTSGGYAIYVLGSGLGFLHNNGPNQTWEVPGAVSGEWEHYCLTFDGATRALYKNGVVGKSDCDSGRLKE